MQNVLSIDASTNPAEALVVGIDGQNISVLEQHFCHATSDHDALSQLKEIISTIKTPWNNSILFLPGNDHISLNLSLPFGEGKQLSKIIEMEVQDVVPFEVDEFSLHHRHVGSLPDGDQDIHVALYPKSKLASVIEESRAAEVEPLIITTPGSALQGLYETHGESLEANTAVILEHPDTVYLGIIVGKKLISDRSLPRNAYSTAASSLINADIELAIRAAEERYGITFDTIYHFSDDTVPTLRSAPNRVVKQLSVLTLFPSIGKKVSPIALLGALFAQDFPAPQILSNFRTRDFAYAPRLSELKRGLSDLAPYLITLILVALVALFTWYWVRNHRIQTLRSTVVSEINSIIPDFSAPEGEEATALQKHASTLQDLLKDLGSPLASSPLDILSIISEDLASVDGVATTRITVKNGEVRIDGTVPNYKTLDRLESTFKRRKNIFCRVKNSAPSAGSRENTRDFQMTLGLCE